MAGQTLHATPAGLALICVSMHAWAQKCSAFIISGMLVVAFGACAPDRDTQVAEPCRLRFSVEYATFEDQLALAANPAEYLAILDGYLPLIEQITDVMPDDIKGSSELVLEFQEGWATAIDELVRSGKITSVHEINELTSAEGIDQVFNEPGYGDRVLTATNRQGQWFAANCSRSAEGS